MGTRVLPSCGIVYPNRQASPYGSGRPRRPFMKCTCNRTWYRRIGCLGSSFVTCRRPGISGFFLLDLQVEDDLLLAVKARDRAGGRRGPVFFGVNLVVGVGVEPAEAIVALVVADITADGVAAGVFQEHHAGGNGRI